MNNMKMNRRNFIKKTTAATIAGIVPMSLIKIAGAQDNQDFTFAYISDSHIQHIRGNEFVRNWDRGLINAVAEANLMNPQPDFVVFGGDLAQMGTKAELDHGMEFLSQLKAPLRGVMGEHDFYLDMGEYWSDVFKSEHYYSFDHKGVHFIVLNSILTYDEWNNKWESDERRMAEMAGLDNPNGSPFMIGDRQMTWLAEDLGRQSKSTPIIVLSHSPLQHIYKGWNFWTEEAPQIQALLAPFEKVNVIYGHVHQIQYNQIGNIAFNSVMATAWPWPYPDTYAKSGSHVPVMTVPMNRADPFSERDATGWQLVNVHTGRIDLEYTLYDNTNRTVGWNGATGRPEDKRFQNERDRIPPQNHY
ncbi:MAG TPA: metallophosphoesterase [Pseudomonadales bacterium]